jgi:hypothetical protein
VDPDEALKKVREALKYYRAMKAERNDEPGDDIADAFEALDQWLSKGGFLPDDWRRKDGST